MNDLQNLGYNKFLTKEDSSLKEIQEPDVDLMLEGVPGEKISKGKSGNAKMHIDYDNGIIKFFKNGILKVDLGALSDGKFGMRVYSDDGQEVSSEIDTP